MVTKIDWESRIGRRLRFRDLHVLSVVVRCGSMAKAAAQLGVTQPSVSEVMADLEHALGGDDSLVAWGASATGRTALDSAWRLLASTFLHAGPGHLFFNATTLIIFGPAVERVFTRSGFWIVYGAGGALASLASLAWRGAHATGGSYSVGASGAIFALGGALMVGAFRLRRRLAVGRARSLAAAVLYLAGTGFAAGFTRNGTDNIAHAAGLLSGALLASVLGVSPRLGGRGAGLLTRVLGALAVLALAMSLAWGIREGLAGG